MDLADKNTSARGAVACLGLATLLAALGTSIANVGLPTLVQVFDASFQQVQWVVIAYLLAMTCVIVGVGRLGDRFGRRRLLIGGLCLFTLAALLGGFAPTLGLLIAARAVQGLGAAIMMALTLAFVSATVPKARAGRAMGVLGTMSALGTALGPALGGVLIAGPGWRAMFWVSVPLGLIVLWLAYRTLPADDAPVPGQKPEAFDGLGMLTLALTLAAYALALTLGRGHIGAVQGGLLLSAALGFALFLRIEARASAPLVRREMLRDPDRRAGLAANALVATVMMATLIVGPFYLAQTLGLSPARVGAVLALGPVLSAVSGVPAGRLVDRWGASFALLLGLGLMLAGALALVGLPPLAGLAGYCAAIALLTPGYQLFQAANNVRVMAEVPADQRGVTSGVLNLARNLGLITGASLMGAIFAFAVGGNDLAAASAAAVAFGLQATFSVAVLLIGAALCLTLSARQKSRAGWRRRFLRRGGG
ncbi:MFS transporter [Elstera litoralis]|uniref:MFS transporter n=1 Tax=Elstera litoralis TaxID=552518 RepID=A0A0F3ITP1_9PROT|nr:MFS transporter [Elstera litoralis]KJV10090.1 MFS transporter [Elstera litoralis]